MTNEFLPSTAQVLPEEQRGTMPARRATVFLGIVGSVVIAVAAIFTWVAARNDPAAGEALFVLPLPVDDWQLSDGTITEPEPDPDASGTDQRFITNGTLYGIADGDGFDGLRSVVHYSESPLPGARWEPAETPVGGSYRRVDESMTFAHEEYDGGWRVVSTPSDLVHAYNLLINETTGLVLVAVYSPPESSETPVTSFMMRSPEGSTFTVETASGSPLFDAATFAERVEPVDVNGTAGWIVSDEGGDATATVVTWAPETGRTVRVRSNAPQDDVVDAARRLQPVSADEWTSSFPGLQRD